MIEFSELFKMRYIDSQVHKIVHYNTFSLLLLSDYFNQHRIKTGLIPLHP